MLNALRFHVVVCGPMLRVPAVRPAIASGAFVTRWEEGAGTRPPRGRSFFQLSRSLAASGMDRQ